MKISRLSVLMMAAVLGASLAMAAGVPQTEDPGVLLRAAIEQEEVNGDLEVAIALYKKVVAAGGGNREVAAKALLRLGGCYEKLGREEAGRIYRQLIADYADQQQQVKLAQERLAALTQKPTVGAKTDMAARRIWSGEGVDTTGAVSPDGRYLSYTDWSSGDLAVRDLIRGESHRITDKGSWSKSDEFAEMSALSPDGNRIAYGWWSSDRRSEIRLIDLEGTHMRVVHAAREPYGFAAPVAWSRDGRWLLALFSKDYRNHELGVVSVDDGSFRILQETGSRFPRVALSPDARHVAYDVRQGASVAERDIFVIPTAGGQATAVVRHAADDSAPVWSPDGKWIVFVSDRAGTPDLWGVQVSGGVAQGEPRRLKGDIGEATPLGITGDGSLYYGLWTGMEDVYTAAVDLRTGRTLASPERANRRFIGASWAPHWSPDGTQLAYVLERSRMQRGFDRLLCIASGETGDSRCLALEGLPDFGLARWSPDGRRLFVYDRGAFGGKRRLCLVDPTTGAVTPLRDLEGMGTGVFERMGAWTPDGKGILLWRRDDRAGVQQLLRFDIETRQEKELYRTTWPPDIALNPDEMAFSPDRRWLAFLSHREGERNLSLMPADGGEPRVLVRLEGEQHIQALAWTPDGTSVLFSRRLDSGKTGLFRISAEGGEPAKLDLEMDSIYYLGVRPDGTRIVFQSGTSSAEIWVLENFLPTLAATAGGSGT